MFEPKYTITNKLLNLIVDLETAKSVVDLIPLSNEWDVKLKKEADVKKAFHSLRFIGNDLGTGDVAKIIDYDPGRDEKCDDVASGAGVVGKEADIQKLVNWLNANRFKNQLSYLGEKFKQSTISEKELTQINSLLLERIVAPNKLGMYRIEDTALDLNGKIDCVPAVEIPFQMEDFFRWYKSVKRDEIHPLLIAGVGFYELLRISPFELSNLLTAVIFCALVLDNSGYNFKGLWSFEESLFRNREVLWMYINEVEKNGGDMTEWLTFFVKCLSISAIETKSKVMMLVGDTPVFRSEAGKALPLTSRQILIMEDLTLRGETTIKEVRGILPTVSDDTILRDLKDLITKKLIKKKGKTKGAVYLLGKIRSFRN